MFRAQQNAFDDVVAKATDENLTSENWEYIMDVCDKVTSEESGAKDVVASLIKRLAHRNANVQLYTLELANALSQNCGTKIYRELASRAFTDALLRLANDRNTHQQVKAKILERMQEWSEMFKDPDLGIMKDQYWKLKTQNPNLHPPSAPQKSRLTEIDRQKEEEELQMALKLSIQDKTTQQQAKTSQPTNVNAPLEQKAAAQQSPAPSGTTAATVSRVKALFDFQATDPDELTFRKGDIIAVLESVYKDWWKGLLRGQTGIFPLNYVEKLADPTPDELQREAQMEAEVFAEIKNVEKLLTLLSTSSSDLNVRDNEEITKLYHSTLAIRPKLIELIGKYSQRKDDFTQLNERFIKSCRDYENLLDASMTQAQPSYQYGRQPQGGHGYGSAGTYPPQGPPQQEPQRYYTPGPQQDQPYPQQPSSPSGYPPRNGPAPFYVVAGGQPSANPGPQGQPGPYPQRGPTPRVASESKPAPLHTTSPPPHQYPSSPPQNQYSVPPSQTGHRPQSTYSNPQELATSSYDSPVNPPPNNGYSGSLYGADDAYNATPISTHPPQQQQQQQPPPQQQKYTAYVPPQAQQQQPSYDYEQHPAQQQPSQQQQQPPPRQPTTAPPSAPPNAGYPVISPMDPHPSQSLDARSSLPSQGHGTPSQPPGSQQYKPYQRPDSRGATPSAPPGAGATGPSAADYYRNTAY